MIDKNYARYIRKDFLKPLIEAEDGPITEVKVVVEHEDCSTRKLDPFDLQNGIRWQIHRLQSGGGGN